MFLDQNYLLSNESAKMIFGSIASLPVVDAHNHVDVKALAQNQPYGDMWQLFAATDHYVWEVMRKCGVAEHFITGGASNFEKFMKLAEIFPDAAGNPVYEWIHLDLRFLGIHEILDGRTGETIYKQGQQLLAQPENLPITMLKRLNIEVMCSTDDPLDDLAEHEVINQKAGKILVRPTWRPDKAMKIMAPAWNSYIDALEKKANRQFNSLDDLLAVLKTSHDYFAAKGCRASDHGLEYAVGATLDEVLAAETFAEVRKGGKATAADMDNYMAVLMNHFGEWNSQSNWVTQLHLGAVRDVRHSLFRTLGPDVGGDISNYNQDQLSGLLPFLNRFDDRLKVVLYCLDPMQQATLATVSRAFGKNVRLGSAWWLCDTPIGMKRQLEYIGSVDVLSVFAGMVSDSRKLLSYGSRFEMFRRILADTLGHFVEQGQIPEEVALKLAAKMAYSGPKAFFNL